MADVTGASDWSDWMTSGLQAAAPGVDDLGELDELLIEADKMMPQALAASTVESYRSKWLPFERWCSRIGADALPARPEVLGAYLLRVAKLGTTRHVDVLVDAGEEGRLSAGSLASVVAAIGAVHRNHGHTGDQDPTQHPRIRRMLGAYGRAYRHHVRRAHGFTLTDLGLMCDRSTLPRRERSRDVLLLCLAANPVVEVTASQLGQLAWGMVELPTPTDGDMPARLTIDSKTVWVPQVADRQICPVQHLRSWAAEVPAVGPVFSNPNDASKAISRQGLAKRVAKLVKELGLTPLAKQGEFYQLTDRQRREAVGKLAAPGPRQIRDRAIMTTFWWTGQRAEVIERLMIGDFRFDDTNDLVAVSVRRSKTDQTGEGASVTLHAQQGYVGCPVSALRDWIRAYAALLGIPATAEGARRVRDEELRQHLAARQVSLFPQMHRAEPGEALGYHGLRDVTQGYARLAGIVEHDFMRIGTQGFRAGNATTMLQAGISAEAVADHQLRADTQYLREYYRPDNDLETNPTRGLAARQRPQGPPELQERPLGAETPDEASRE